MPIPSTVEELTPQWLGEVLDAEVRTVEVLEAHSGTTGRVRIRLTSDSPAPASVFVKIQPFDQQQREYVRMIGMGVAEACLYAELGGRLPVRIPRVWHSSYDRADGSFVMVLEDLLASGCRFPSAEDDDVLDVAGSLMEELAVLHSAYRDQPLPWLRAEPLGASDDEHQRARLGRLAEIVQSAVDRFAGDLPPEFRRLGELFVRRSHDVAALWNEGAKTLVHGDDHIRNLFVDRGRTGFFDWAVACRAPGIRDVSYFLCNSLPTEVRRSEQGHLLAAYRESMAARGIVLDQGATEEQYRLFATYSWMSATTTAAMGSAWHPADIGHAAMVRTTRAVVDLDVLGLYQELLGPV